MLDMVIGLGDALAAPQKPHPSCPQHSPFGNSGWHGSQNLQLNDFQGANPRLSSALQKRMMRQWW
jgi:hypothetical protein